MGDCRCKSVGSRPGLYIMVFLILLNSCEIEEIREALQQQGEQQQEIP